MLQQDSIPSQESDDSLYSCHPSDGECVDICNEKWNLVTALD